MRWCLIMMVGQHDGEMLRLHLPAYREVFDGFIVVANDAPEESVAFVEAHGAHVEHRAWDWKHGPAQNRLIDLAEAQGYDAVLKSDPDECWFPADLKQIRRDLEDKWLGVALPTFNFMGDRRHYCPYPPFYPDLHMRAWKLNLGIRYVRDRHAIPNRADLGWLDYQQMLVRHDAHLYHYGWTTPWAHREWIMANYARAEAGQEPIPWGTPVPAEEKRENPHWTIPFVGLQPIDPNIIGG